LLVSALLWAFFFWALKAVFHVSHPPHHSYHWAGWFTHQSFYIGHGCYRGFGIPWTNLFSKQVSGYQIGSCTYSDVAQQLFTWYLDAVWAIYVGRDWSQFGWPDLVGMFMVGWTNFDRGKSGSAQSMSSN
jgi:hypothetical protein